MFKLHAITGIFLCIITDRVFSHPCSCKIDCQLMLEISILHDHVTAFFYGQSKIFFLSERRYSKEQYIAPKYLKGTKQD